MTDILTQTHICPKYIKTHYSKQEKEKWNNRESKQFSFSERK